MHFCPNMFKKVSLFNHFIIILFKFTTQKRGKNANPATEDLGSDIFTFLGSVASYCSLKVTKHPENL